MPVPPIGILFKLFCPSWSPTQILGCPILPGLTETHRQTWRTLRSFLSEHGDTCSIQEWAAFSWKHDIDFVLDAIAGRIGTLATRFWLDIRSWRVQPNSLLHRRALQLATRTT